MWLEVAVFIVMMVGTILLTAALCSAIFTRRLNRVRVQEDKLAREQENFRLKYLAQTKDYEALCQRYKALDVEYRKEMSSNEVVREPTEIQAATLGHDADIQSQLLDAQSRCKQCENEKKLLLRALEDLQEQLAQGGGSNQSGESKPSGELNLAAAPNVVPLLQKVERTKVDRKKGDSKSEGGHHQTVVTGEPDSKEAVFARIKDRSMRIDFERIGRVPAEERDDLQRIKGIGPHIEQKLNSAGIYSLRQISRFTMDDEKLVNEVIEFFPGRISRDQWVVQASKLLEEE